MIYFGFCSKRVLQTITRLLLFFGGIILAVNLLISWTDRMNYAGVDLRPKVVGARALIAGRDPYTYYWNAADGERLLDPTHPIPGPSGNMYAPSMLLLLYAPTCWLDYHTLRSLWFCAEWAALLLSIFLLSRLIRSKQLRSLFLLIAIYFFVNSNFWRLHVERGQYYVFLLLLGTLGWYVYTMHPKNRWLGMVILGVLAACRPTYAIIALPLWLLHFRREAFIMLISCATAMSLTLPVGGLRAWKRYVQNVELTQAAMLDPSLVEKKFGPAQSLPPLVEGVDFHRAFETRSTSTTFIQLIKPRLVGDPLHKMHFVTWHVHWDEQKTNLWLLRVDRLLSALFVLGFALLAWINRGRVQSFRIALLIGFIVAMDTDYFLPQRYSHGDVLFLWLLALGLPVLFYRRSCFPLLLLVAGGILFGHSIIPTTDWSFITSLRSLLIMTGFNILAISSLMRCPSSTRETHPQ